MPEADLQYLRNRDLRERISRMVGVEPGSRYRDDHGAGMPKVVVVEVARELGVERVDDRDLEELYRGICDTLGVERPSSSGNLWGLRREVLKEIVRELQSVHEPAKKLVADGGEEVGREIPHEDEWDFAEGDIIREQHEPHAPGGVGIGKSEYRVKWRLVRPSNGKRCYHVEKEEGGTHLYTAGAVEGRYEVISASESRAFDEDDGEQNGGVEW